MADDSPLSLSGLRRRTTALETERAHYADLGLRAADAFEDHRRELTQLAQKERAIRAHREDLLRTQLQDTLQANRALMARVEEQRRHQEEAWVAELQRHRSEHAVRQGELETTLTRLHDEWAEVRRNVAETRAAHDTQRTELAACLQDQASLRERVRALKHELPKAEAAAAAAELAAASTPTHTPPPPSPAYRTTPRTPLTDRDVFEHDRAHRVPFSPRRVRQPCCSYCDVGPHVWGGSSPTRRVPRRRFLPSGPVDLSSPARATSPRSHHIDGMVATLQRENLLRPRLYYRRVGGGPAGMAGEPAYESTRTSLVPGQRIAWTGDAAAPLMPPPHPTTAVAGALPLPSAASSQRRRASPDRARGRHAPGLSSSSSSSSSAAAAATANTSSSSTSCTSSSCTCTCSCESCAQARAHVPSHRSSDRSRNAVASARAAKDVQPAPSRGTPTPLTPTAGSALHGTALNATCRSLLTDLAEMRTEYRQWQQQLRDPQGDSVAASREMRRLMHSMDSKGDQICTLRREQGRHQDALRMQDVLREVIAENRYCEAVYADLMDLIRA